MSANDIESNIEKMREFVHVLDRFGLVSVYQKLNQDLGFRSGVRELYARHPELSQSMRLESILT